MDWNAIFDVLYWYIMSYKNNALAKMSWSTMSRLWAVLLVVELCSPAFSAENDWDASVYKGWIVKSVTIEGLDKDTAAMLKKGLGLALPSGLLRIKKPILFPQTLDEDIRRSLLFLARRGYPHAQVTPRFVPDAKKEQVELILHVERGPAVRIASVALTGFPPDLEEEARRTLKVTVNSAIEDAEVEQSKTALVLLLTGKGYARATIASTVTWMDSTHVALRFDAQPGEMYYFGDVIAIGSSEDVISLIQKVVTVRRGKRYNPKTLGDSEEKLRILDLFRRIRIDVKEAARDTLDCIIDVDMKASRRWEIAVRYWTDERIDGSVSWKHRNLFKRGRGGSVLASASFIQQKLEFSAWWPALLMAPSRGTVSLSIENETEESYDLLSYGGSIGLNYDFSLLTRLRVSLVFSNIDITEKTPEADVLESQDGTLNSIQFRWERNASNHPIVPTQGTHTYAEMEWAPDTPLNDYRFVSVSPTGIIYIPITQSHRWVLASRLTAGLAEPLGNLIDLLPNKRFYSGGSTSMRGFKRRKLGPLDSNDAPLGGEAKLEASAELRFPFFWKFMGALFVDAGQVWSKFDNIKIDHLEVAPGFGLWIITPIGPLRFDQAFRLTDYDKTQPQRVFHFSIGPAF
jgi:outer membrane protein insertion porin family